jgi:hypothetical protein
MGNVSTKCQIGVPASLVYEYLKGSYLDTRFLNTFKECRGYIPSIQLKENIKNRKLAYFVSGRDGLTKIKTGSWEWSFVIEELASLQTQVTISYSWNMFMDLIGIGTIKAQATNETAENIRLLTALEFAYKTAGSH